MSMRVEPDKTEGVLDWPIEKPYSDPRSDLKKWNYSMAPETSVQQVHRLLVEEKPRVKYKIF